MQNLKLYVPAAIALILLLTAGIILLTDKIKNKSVKNSVAVLCYHDADKKENAEKYYSRNFISVDNFEKQMEYLYNEHYKTLTLDEFYDFVTGKKVLSEKSVLITFDDNRKNIYDNAYPILKKYNFHAVGFVITGQIGKKNRLSKDELDKMTDVFEYASHTHNMHKKIDGKKSEILKSQTYDIEKDISESLKFVEPYFAYPFGQHNKKLIPILKNQGIKAAFTLKRGKVKAGDSLFKLKRNIVYDKISLKDFCKIVK